jgi:transcriptional regulator with XRE-family HTH domain
MPFPDRLGKLAVWRYVAEVASDDDPDLLGLGAYIRAQRQLANLSVRKLASLADVSNPYLSQVERGLHAPSVRVLRSIARALDMSAEELLREAGLGDDGAVGPVDAERAIRSDPQLTESQRAALLSVYRSYVDANRRDR